VILAARLLCEGFGAALVGVVEQLEGSSMGISFLDATAGEVPEFMSVNVFTVISMRAPAERLGIEPRFAQANIGDGGARVDDYAVAQRKAMQDALPCIGIANDVHAMSAHKGEFTDEAL